MENNRPKLSCYAPQLTSRFCYTAQLVFEQHLGLSVVFTQDTAFFRSISTPKLCYAPTNIDAAAFFIESTTLLFENTIENAYATPEAIENDVLAKIFWHVSRYEEYTAPPLVFDTHGRFSAAASWSKKRNMLRQPFINQWIIKIGDALNIFFPDFHLKPPPQYDAVQKGFFLPTYDVDQAWAYLNKGWQRNIGGFFKDFFAGRWVAAFRRLGVLLGWKKDPEYTFDYWAILHDRHRLSAIVFWLLGDYSAHDKNIDWQNRRFRATIKKQAQTTPFGIHPSYYSDASPDVVRTEIDRLAEITQERVRYSRQHFLKLKMPQTYRTLLENGIEADFSMGYADDIGFRAGISTPFYWFDLVKNEATALKIYPFAVMDVTLKEYLKLTPDEAVSQVQPLIEAARASGGNFSTLWHNSTLSDKGDWRGWRVVYEKIVVSACNNN